MSVIIRLQNLPWSANALDIRQHFQGLSIPEGGVHIVGGEEGDAFIAFSTDEDARQAMMNGDGKIKEVKVKLLLSSRTEMQKVIEQARQQSLSLQNLLQMPAPPITTPIIPIPIVPAAVADVPKLVERRDSDTTSNSDKERRSERKDRSRSRDRRRRSRDRKSRSRSRERRRTNDNRRRRKTSRDRTSRDRRSRSRSRDRRRTSDNRRNSRERNDRRRDFNADDNKSMKPDLNGVNKSMNPAIDSNSGWDGVSGPGAVVKQMGFSKGPVIPSHNVTSVMDTSTGRGDMDGRRIMGSGPFTSVSMRPIPGTDNIPGPFQANRDTWQNRPGEVGARFPPVDRQSFTGDVSRVGFGGEGNDFDGRSDFVPRAGSFRGGHQRGGSDVRRPPFLAGRPSGPGNILGPPGTMIGSNIFPRPPGPMDSFQRGDRPFESFPNRSTFSSDRFNRSYDPRSQIPKTCVEMRNLPLDSGYSDIRKFFQGIYVANNAIKMLNDAKGHRTGIAYIRFSNSDAKERAIKMTGKLIRGSIIELMHLDDQIFENSVDSYKPDSSSYKSDSSLYKPEPSLYKPEPSSYKPELSSYKPEPSSYKPETSSYKIEQNSFKLDSSEQVLTDDEPMIIEHTSPCLQIQDLPPYTTEGDIIKLFPNFKIADVILTYHKVDKKQAMAYIKFVRPEDGKAALFSSQKHMIGHVTVKVSLCSLDLYEMAKKSVNLKKDVKDTPTNGSQVKDPRNRLEPERNRMEPERSRMESERSRMEPERNRMEPERSRNEPERSRNETERSRNEPERSRNEPERSRNEPERSRNEPERSRIELERSRVEPELVKVNIAPVGMLSDCILLKGLPYQTNDRDILDFFSDVALVPARIHVMLDNFNKPSGDAYCEFASCEETMRAVTKNGTMLGKQEVTVKPVMRHDMLEALGLPPQPDLQLPNMNMHGAPRLPFMRNFAGGRPMGILGNRPPRMPMRGGHHMIRMGSAFMGMGHIPPKEPVEGFGSPGCVLALENIPFRAEVEEILHLFADFDVSRENVIRRFNEMGMPTGDARVSLPSPSEAQRALRELRGKPIRGRQIFLSIL